MKSIKQYLQNSKGYTLIELLVVVTIVGVIIGSIGQFLVTQLNVFNHEMEKYDLIEESAMAVNMCSAAIMPAQSVSSMELDGAGAMKNMTLQTPDTSTTPATFIATVFSIDAGVLSMTVGSKAPRIVARDLESVKVVAIFSDGSEGSRYVSSADNDVLAPTTAGLRTAGIRMTFKFKGKSESVTKEMTACFRN